MPRGVPYMEMSFHPRQGQPIDDRHRIRLPVGHVDPFTVGTHGYLLGDAAGGTWAITLPASVSTTTTLEELYSDTQA